MRRVVCIYAYLPQPLIICSVARPSRTTREPRSTSQKDCPSKTTRRRDQNCFQGRLGFGNFLSARVLIVRTEFPHFPAFPCFLRYLCSSWPSKVSLACSRTQARGAATVSGEESKMPNNRVSQPRLVIALTNLPTARQSISPNSNQPDCVPPSGKVIRERKKWRTRNCGTGAGLPMVVRT